MDIISQSAFGLELKQEEELKLPSRLARCIYYIRSATKMQLNALTMHLKQTSKTSFTKVMYSIKIY